MRIFKNKDALRMKAVKPKGYVPHFDCGGLLIFLRLL